MGVDRHTGQQAYFLAVMGDAVAKWTYIRPPAVTHQIDSLGRR